MNKKVVYTSVFGCSEENNYHLHDPDVSWMSMILFASQIILISNLIYGMSGW